MSDDEFETTSNCSKTSKGDETFAKRKQGVQKNELNNQLKEYINEWRKTREKEEDELQKMKEKQSKRKEAAARRRRNKDGTFVANEPKLSDIDESE